MVKLTAELDKRLQKTFRAFTCNNCDGYGVCSQSPHNPQGYMCEECNSSGFNNDGSTFNDFKKRDVSCNRRLYRGIF